MNATQDSFIAKWKELAGQGLRLTTLKTYVAGNQRLWAGVWRAGNDPYYLWMNSDFNGFVVKWKELGAQNLRLVGVQKYAFNLTQTDQPSRDALAEAEPLNGDGEGGGSTDVSVAGVMSAVGGGELSGDLMGAGYTATGAPTEVGGGDVGEAPFIAATATAAPTEVGGGDVSLSTPAGYDSAGPGSADGGGLGGSG